MVSQGNKQVTTGDNPQSGEGSGKIPDGKYPLILKATIVNYQCTFDLQINEQSLLKIEGDGIIGGNKGEEFMTAKITNSLNETIAGIRHYLEKPKPNPNNYSNYISGKNVEKMYVLSKANKLFATVKGNTVSIDLGDQTKVTLILDSNNIVANIQEEKFKI